MKLETSIKVEKSHRDSMASIVKKLEEEGVDVGQMLKAIGVINAKMDPSLKDKVESIPGIQMVREQKNFALGPDPKKRFKVRVKAKGQRTIAVPRTVKKK